MQLVLHQKNNKMLQRINQIGVLRLILVDMDKKLMAGPNLRSIDYGLWNSTDKSVIPLSAKTWRGHLAEALCSHFHTPK